MIKSWNDERIFTVSEDCNKTIGLIQDKEQTFPMSLLVLLLIISCWTPVEPACKSLREATSTLTIYNVSRTDPFDMEVKWICEQCRGYPITACNKLEVYAPPESPSCTVREDTESGDIKSVNVSCSTSKVYPKARCRFFREKDRKRPVTIPNPVYSHTPTVAVQQLYHFFCSHSQKHIQFSDIKCTSSHHQQFRAVSYVCFHQKLYHQLPLAN
ncbi:hypothetical protein RRG08_066900 [Elysia crispata]|uniref:Uncharacterized protein n=1 Tax=Elysia crispata TaxID=231223 RepID=A0AAE0Z134_9GAST|nr:hypothetical protein RRG08_066900 [Elysia crispata]